MNLPEKYAKWKGVPREEFNWNPIIDEDKCIGCGMCVTSCGRNVFDYDPKKNKAVVARPLQCLVGCSSCGNWCIFDAISFPDPKEIKRLIKGKKLLVLAKKELEQNKTSQKN